MLTHFKNLAQHFRRGGASGGFWWFRKLWYRKVARTIEGMNVFDKGWDLLILLDGCNPQWIRDVSTETEWLPDDSDQETIISVGSTSFEWYEKTFSNRTERELTQTAVVSANPFADEYVPESIGLIDHLMQWGWEDNLATVPAHTVTDAAVDIGRRTDFKRYIVHYMQPHLPLLECVGEREEVDSPTGVSDCWDVWWATMRGDYTPSELESDYKNNLRYVLPEVQLLLENFDAETVIISSDHSNAVGEQGMYGHPGYVEMPLVKKVPWVQTTGNDNYILEPAPDRSFQSSSKKERLRSLGYV